MARDTSSLKLNISRQEVDVNNALIIVSIISLWTMYYKNLKICFVVNLNCEVCYSFCVEGCL
jgi:hypothetical protein